MIFGKTKLELKVGAFVFCGLIILSIFILSVGKIKTWASGYRFNCVFNFVNGVKLGAPVRFAGVDVGEIKKIEFFKTNGEEKDKVRLTCFVKNKIRIPVDSNVWVNTLGLLGEKYIEIMPGNDTKNFIVKDQCIKGTDPMAMQEIGEMAKKIALDLDASLVKIKNGEGTVGKLIVNDSIYNNLDAMTEDLKNNPWKLFYKGTEKSKTKK